MSKSTAEMPVSTAGREPAPSVEVSVQTVLRDERRAIVDELAAKNPEYVFKYQRHDVDQQELDRKGQEIVMDPKSGKPVNHMGDPVVRVKKEVDLAQRTARNALSYKMIEGASQTALETGNDLRKVASPKQIVSKPSG